MILIEEEPKDLYKNFRVYEKCIFCSTDTKFWNIGYNQPICEKCAKVKSNKDIKKLIK